MNHIIDSIVEDSIVEDSIETDYDIYQKQGMSEEVIKETLSVIWIPDVVEEFFENKK